MGDDEEATLVALRDCRNIIDKLVDDHHGRVFGSAGDSVIAEFPSPVEAVRCALAVQRSLEVRNADVPNERAMQIRIGVNLGDVMAEGDNLLGDGVNIAARLEALAEPGGIAISSVIHDHLSASDGASFVDSGEQKLKNIARPVRVWHWPEGAAETTGKTAPLALPDKPSLAVLPFTNMSGDPEQEYFSDGITEDIITELSRFKELFVIARNSSFTFKGQAVDVKDVGRELGVAYVVEGSIRKAGNRVRVTAQLIDAATGNHVWADRYDRELNDIFAVQDEVSREIVSTLPRRLQGAMIEGSYRKPSENLTAYDLYLRGRWEYDSGSGDDASTLAFFERAIKIDPRCAHAYASIAVVHAYSHFNLRSWTDDAASLAKENISQALAFGEGDPTIHARTATAYIDIGEHDLAMSQAERAIALNPNDVGAVRAYGVVLAYCGDPEEGLRWLLKAHRLDPKTPMASLESLAECHYLSHDYQAPIDLFSRLHNPPPHIYPLLAACHAQLGQVNEARAAVEAHERTRPDDTDFPAFVAAHMRMCKHQEHADHWLEGYRKAGLIDV